MKQKIKTFQLRSVMPNGMHKGWTIQRIIQEYPHYMIYLYKRKQIRLSGRATTALLWRLQELKDAE